jgi:hypothetical protein
MPLRLFREWAMHESGEGKWTHRHGWLENYIARVTGKAGGKAGSKAGGKAGGKAWGKAGGKAWGKTSGQWVEKKTAKAVVPTYVNNVPNKKTPTI